MKTKDFHYELPGELIAQHPLPERSASRLMQVHTNSTAPSDYLFRDLPQLLDEKDLLVFNDTRVINARLYGRKATGGRVEILIERLLDERQALAQLKSSKALKPGAEIELDQGLLLRVQGRYQDFYQLALVVGDGFETVMTRFGHVPLPPYIDRPDELHDLERYQTVYSRKPGAVAAPTAGLHFDQALLNSIDEMGVSTTSVTLHVGAGTFKPVRVEDPATHKMHSERFEVSRQVCEAVENCRARGGRVIAVGTTAIRALESAASSGKLQPARSETKLFITPGFEFRVVDSLITNFHLPESTLLMLVCAFGGYEFVMDAYRHAVQHRYRFFSYGDAMFLNRLQR